VFLLEHTLQGRDLISIRDLHIDDMLSIFELSKKIQNAPQEVTEVLKGKVVAIAFLNPVHYSIKF